MTDWRVLFAAEVAHDANAAYCIALGDPTPVPWPEAPMWQRESAIQGVYGVLRGATPADSHAGWLAHKEADGWKYGPVKDAEARTHPCMVPFEELPPEQQAKDHLFVRVVSAALQAVERLHSEVVA